MEFEITTNFKIVVTIVTFAFYFFLGYWIAGWFTSKRSWTYGWGLALAAYNSYEMVQRLLRVEEGAT